jgi:hypothetical protein
MEAWSNGSDIYIQNGTSATFAFPCFYYLADMPQRPMFHRRDVHDYLGWPSPSHPGHACQVDVVNWQEAVWPIGCEDLVDLEKLMPIHLLAEGYDAQAEVLLGSDEITATAVIDSEQDHVVRVSVSAELAAANESGLDFLYTLRVNNPAAGRKDVVAKGKIVVMPAYVSGSVEPTPDPDPNPDPEPGPDWPEPLPPIIPGE